MSGMKRMRCHPEKDKGKTIAAGEARWASDFDVTVTMFYEAGVKLELLNEVSPGDFRR